MFANNSRPPTMADYDPSAKHSPPQLATSSRLTGHGGLIIQPARMTTTSSIPVLHVKNKRGMFDTWSTWPEWIGWSYYRGDRWILQSKRLSWCRVVESTSSISVLCAPRRSQFTSELTIRIWGKTFIFVLIMLSLFSFLITLALCQFMLQWRRPIPLSTYLWWARQALQGAGFLIIEVNHENPYIHLSMALTGIFSMAGANDDFLGYLRTMWEENNEKLVCASILREEMDDDDKLTSLNRKRSDPYLLNLNEDISSSTPVIDQYGKSYGKRTRKCWESDPWTIESLGSIFSMSISLNMIWSWSVWYWMYSFSFTNWGKQSYYMHPSHCVDMST